MNYGYIRVSSDKQTVENQRFEITQYCEHNHIQIDEWIKKTIIVILFCHWMIIQLPYNNKFQSHLVDNSLFGPKY